MGNGRQRSGLETRGGPRLGRRLLPEVLSTEQERKEEEDRGEERGCLGNETIVQ